MLPWKLNPVQVLALASLAILLGSWIKKKLPILDRLCIPTSIVGGLAFALIVLFLHIRGITVEADATLRDLMMIAFMTTVGLQARPGALRRDGVKIVSMLVVASAGAVLQNLLGIALARMLFLDPLLGIITGSVALAGGPATALAFGQTFEKMGVAGAVELGVAAATFGIAVSGLIAGYIGHYLIRRHHLVPKEPLSSASDHSCAGGRPPGALSMLHTLLLIGMAMGLGNLISVSLERLGMILPSYIGAMLAAAVLGNLNSRWEILSIPQSCVEECSVISLYLFIVMATMTLRLWELAHLVLPMLAILACQVGLCWILCVTLSFRAMGRDYESAVMASGFCGFMLGITANAVASMEELVEKYGPAPRAFLVVPAVGAFLVDFTNAFIITIMANLVKWIGWVAPMSK